MDRKLSILLVGAVVCWCHLASSIPITLQQLKFASIPDGRDYLDKYLTGRESFEPLAISKREAPVYEAKEDQYETKEDAKKDLKTAATGYGYGGGHGGGYGHGSNSPTGYVSYGAKTGGYGAFSWYSDHPAGTYGYH